MRVTGDLVTPGPGFRNTSTVELWRDYQTPGPERGGPVMEGERIERE